MVTFEEILEKGTNEDFDRLMGIQQMIILIKSLCDQNHISIEDAKESASRAFEMKGKLNVNNVQQVATEIFNKRGN